MPYWRIRRDILCQRRTKRLAPRFRTLEWGTPRTQASACIEYICGIPGAVMLAMKRVSSINTIFFIGNYLPRKCGIATFTTDLCDAVAQEARDTRCSVIAMNDIPEGYRYPDRVSFEVAQNRLADYGKAADYLNMNQVDVVCVQHEYGIFGGPSGSYVLALLRELRMPVVTTLHTILREPSDGERLVLEELCQISDRVVTMSRRGYEFLRDIYSVPESKITHIHHGIPNVPFMDTSYYKDQFDAEGKLLMLTFGLLSPGKGLELSLEALPGVVDRYPQLVYIILGATHPATAQKSGEEYRLCLRRLAKKLGIQRNVIFVNRFVELRELREYLCASDVYVAPYTTEEQITSGTLAYALGAGSAIVSTPNWYAQELLGEGRGRLVPFADPEAMSKEIIDLFDHPVERNFMRKKAYLFGRDMIWQNVARRYFELFARVREERRHVPHLGYSAIFADFKDTELPEIGIDHLRLLTDDTGILQHAHFTMPNRRQGYCSDDNARALVVALKAKAFMHEDAALNILASRYLTFLEYAFNDEIGRFRNFMTYDRRWKEQVGSEDCHARSLLGLGFVVGMNWTRGVTALAMRLFARALPVLEGFSSPRSWAYAIVGIREYLRQFGGDHAARRMLEVLSNRLYDHFIANAVEGWPWLEDTLTYANGAVSQALLASGRVMERDDMLEMGLRSLRWLMEIQTSADGHLSLVGNNGWYLRGGEMARFDQQPIGAQSLLEACFEAQTATGDDLWRAQAHRCFNWFLGLNDIGVLLYDSATGGCRDGLHPDGVSENEGAESTLAWLQSLLSMYSLRDRLVQFHPRL